MGRHGSTESSQSWRSVRSNDTVRPFGGRGSLRGTPVTVQTSKDPNFLYVSLFRLSFRLVADWTVRPAAGDLRAPCASITCAEGALPAMWRCLAARQSARHLPADRPAILSTPHCAWEREGRVSSRHVCQTV